MFNGKIKERQDDDDNDDDDGSFGDYRVFVQMKFAIYIEAANQICTTDDVTELTLLLCLCMCGCFFPPSQGIIRIKLK